MRWSRRMSIVLSFWTRDGAEMKLLVIVPSCGSGYRSRRLFEIGFTTLAGIVLLGNGSRMNEPARAGFGRVELTSQIGFTPLKLYWYFSAKVGTVLVNTCPRFALYVSQS